MLNILWPFHSILNLIEQQQQNNMISNLKWPFFVKLYPVQFFQVKILSPSLSFSLSLSLALSFILILIPPMVVFKSIIFVCHAK